jgi:SAM-dependent methyltransferase
MTTADMQEKASNSVRTYIAPDIQEATVPPDDPKLARKLALGKRLSEAVDLYKQTEELQRLADVIKAQSVDDKLSEGQLQQLRSHQQNTMLVEQWRVQYRNTDHRYSLQGIAYYALEELLSKDRTIRSVLNIGCSYGYMDSLLAKDHSTIRFTGVDVTDDTPQKNADLSLPNLEFKAGYALDMLEEGSLAADMAYMSSTATVIRNAELHRYVRALKPVVKYVMISEPIWPLPGYVIRSPREMSVTESEPGYVQRDPLTGTYGYLCWNHNYAGILENGGYDIVSYRFYRPDFTYLYWCVAVGQNRNAQLW